MARKKYTAVDIVSGLLLGFGLIFVFNAILFSDWWTQTSALREALPGSEYLPDHVLADIAPDQSLSLYDGAPVIGAIELGLLALAFVVYAASFGRYATRRVAARAWLLVGACSCGLILGAIATQLTPAQSVNGLGSAWIGLLFGWGLLLAAVAAAYFGWRSELEPEPVPEAT